jgi:CelD/BcsL family acetyltransferase involved in cellulose biosynthesis
MVISQTYRVSIEAQGAAARPGWENLVAQDRSVALSKTPEWIDCICSSGVFSDATVLFRGEDGRRLVLPRVKRRGVAGLFEAPPPGWDLGSAASGFLSEPGPNDPTRALTHAIWRQPGLRTRITVGGQDAEAWAGVVPSAIYSTARTAQVLDLRGGFGTVWSSRFTSKVRSNARKAERRGVVVESDSTGRLVAAFDSLYRSSVDRWAQQRSLPLTAMRWLAQRRNPRRKFATVAARMGEHCTIWMASRGGEPLAGIFVLTRGPWATYWRGAMDAERARGTGANELLHRCAIEAACATQRRSYDFGISQTDDLKRFKNSFGTIDVPVRTYYFESLPTAAAEAKGYRAVKEVVRAIARREHPSG